ncbi:hypothetical protein TcCL_NonESM05806 [Trypanosoma cruzi]|nr:hypothetical protein TcCL_NonESM05806 [Trypanosoma cruzi]
MPRPAHSVSTGCAALCFSAPPRYCTRMPSDGPAAMPPPTSGPLNTLPAQGADEVTAGAEGVAVGKEAAAAAVTVASGAPPPFSLEDSFDERNWFNCASVRIDCCC